MTRRRELLPWHMVVRWAALIERARRPGTCLGLWMYSTPEEVAEAERAGGAHLAAYLRRHLPSQPAFLVRGLTPPPSQRRWTRSNRPLKRIAPLR